MCIIICHHTHRCIRQRWKRFLQSLAGAAPPAPVAEPAADADKPAEPAQAPPPINIVAPPIHVSKHFVVPPKYPRPSRSPRAEEPPNAFIGNVHHDLQGSRSCRLTWRMWLHVPSPLGRWAPRFSHGERSLNKSDCFATHVRAYRIWCSGDLMCFVCTGGLRSNCCPIALLHLPANRSLDSQCRSEGDLICMCWAFA